MASAGDDSGLFRFATADLPERDRLAIFREQFGRKIARFEFEPLTDDFHADIRVRAVAGLGLASVDHSLMRVGRTRELLADGDDSLVLQIPMGGCHAVQFGREVLAEPGDAMLGSNGDTGTFTCSLAGGTSLLISLSRQDLQPLIRDFDAILLRRVPAREPALRLLMTYVGIFEQTLAPELQRLAVSHVYDLVAVMLGATRDASNVAAGRGVRAARLRAIKADVVGHLGERDLSINAVAKRNRISPVYIRKLFESEGTSFSEFALEQRLARVHRMLRDPRFAERAISTIALEVGFGDLSYFNRTFRRRYGASPSELRVSGRERDQA